jgi:hypothetical protein
LHSADLTGEILKMKLPQMPGQFGILVNRPELSRRPFALGVKGEPFLTAPGLSRHTFAGGPHR